MAIGDEMGSDGFLPKSFAKAPEAPAEQNTEIPLEGNAQPAGTETQPTQTAQAQSQPTSEPKPDEFIENFNKRYSSQFKTDDDIKGLFGLPQKVGEYETKLKDFDKNAQRIAELERLNEEIKNAGNSELFEKPLIRKAYVASQLSDRFKGKYSEKGLSTLQEIAMSDVDKMSDLEILVKERMTAQPEYNEGTHKAVLFKRLGIDIDSNPAEWDDITKLTIAEAAQEARNRIKSLTEGIELPKMVTKEERERLRNEATQKRITETTPLKDKFTQFDKFKDGDFEYDVPGDYKSKLGDMFQAMFVDAGMDATQEALDAAIDMRDSLFLKQNFSKIKEVITKQAQVELQKKLDEALNNTKPPNTATATDDSTPKNDLPGKSLSQALQNNEL